MKCFVIPKATDATVILRMGSLSSAPYSTFHWYFKKLFILSLSLRGDTAFWAPDHAEVLLYGSYGGACHSFHLFSHGNCNPVHLSWISHIHYRTMLVVIPFFSLLQSEKKKLASFDQNWFWPHLGDAMMKQKEISGSFSHWSRVGKCLVIPVRSLVPGNMSST